MSDPLVEILEMFQEVDTDVTVQCIYNGYVIKVSGQNEGGWCDRTFFVPDSAAIKVFFDLLTNKANV